MSVVATFTGSTPEEVVVFLADQRQRMKPFRRVVVCGDQTRVLDVNRNEAVFPGVTLTVMRCWKASCAVRGPPLTRPTSTRRPPDRRHGNSAARRAIRGRTTESCNGAARRKSAGYCCFFPFFAGPSAGASPYCGACGQGMAFARLAQASHFVMSSLSFAGSALARSRVSVRSAAMS